MIRDLKISTMIKYIKESFTRFPVTYIAFIALWALCANDEIVSNRTNTNPDFFVSYYIFEIFFVFLGLINISLRIFCEQYDYRKQFDASISALVATILSLWLAYNNPTTSWAPIIYIVFGLLVMGLIAPFFKYRNNIRLNEYWKSILNSLKYTVLSYLILLIGTMLIVAMVLYVLGLEQSGRVYFHIWLFITIIGLPVFFTVGVPTAEQIKNSEQKSLAKPERAIVLWLLMPLLLIMLALIHVLAIKITLITHEINSSVFYLSFIATFFSLVLYVNSLVQFHKETKLEVFFKKYLFYFMIIPCLLLSVIYLYQYDFYIDGQISRYYFIFTMWLTGNTIYGIWKGNKLEYDIRLPVLSASITLLLIGILKI